MAKLGIGVIGCGNISMTYMRNATLFPSVELRACADLDGVLAQHRAAEHGIRALSVEDLLASADVDLILNLTVPNAHFEVSLAALQAGKHVFTEKPFAVAAAQGRTLVAEARRRTLAIGSAPDTFLGAAGRLARRLVDAGAIGRPVAGTAFMMGRGMEHWHPNPRFFYQPGGGPVLDMAPYYLTMLVSLLGPVARVTGIAAIGSPERLITAEGPYKNTTFTVGTPTTAMAVLAFASGAVVALGMSWDVFRHSLAPIEIHGTDGSLSLPDPDTFGGEVALSERGAAWRRMDTSGQLNGRINWPFDAPRLANYRMIGVADLAAALAAGRPPRASGELALHVLEVMEGILGSAEQGGIPVDLPPASVQPAPLGEEEAASLHKA